MDKQWIEESTPLVAPDAKFRQELARALHDTHQRQQVQRRLYSDSAPHRPDRSPGLWLAVYALLALLFALGYYLGRRSRR